MELVDLCDNSTRETEFSFLELANPNEFSIQKSTYFHPKFYKNQEMFLNWDENYQPQNGPYKWLFILKLGNPTWELIQIHTYSVFGLCLSFIW